MVLPLYSFSAEVMPIYYFVINMGMRVSEYRAWACGFLRDTQDVSYFNQCIAH